MAFIECKDVSFSYGEGENRKAAVKHLSLSIEKGTFTAVLGHNGSGKSTLAKLLCSILLPDEGEIFVDGMKISDENLSEDDLIELHRKVGMVFQNPDNQLVATVVEEDVAFGPENLGVEPAEIRRRVDEVLKIMEISEYARHSPTRLSGGQKQRVAVAGILAMRPSCMIFDEATAMLDPQGRKEVMETIGKLHDEMGITVIHITHNMEEALEADRVIVLNDGVIALDGTPHEVFSETEAMQRMGLDVQQPTKLLHELRLAGVPLDDGITDLDACAREICRFCAGKKQ